MNYRNLRIRSNRRCHVGGIRRTRSDPKYKFENSVMDESSLRAIIYNKKAVYIAITAANIALRKARATFFCVASVAAFKAATISEDAARHAVMMANIFEQYTAVEIEKYTQKVMMSAVEVSSSASASAAAASAMATAALLKVKEETERDANAYKERREEEAKAHIAAAKRAVCKCTLPSYNIVFPKFNWADSSYPRNALILLEKEIYELYGKITEEVFSLDIVSVFVPKIKKSIESIIPDQKVFIEIYGSHNTRLSLPSSNLDLLVNFELEKEIFAGKRYCDSYLKTLLYHIGQGFAKKTWIHNIKYSNAKDLSIKFDVDHPFRENRQLPINVTLGWKNTSPSEIHIGIQAAELINSYKNKLPALEVMVTIAKHCFIEWGLGNAEVGLPDSHCIVIMVATFLQYAYRSYGSTYGNHVGGLFIDFLNFYGNYFDCRTMGLRYYSEEKFHYLARISDTQCFQRQKKNFPYCWNLVIDDPIDEKNNIASTVTEFSKVKETFKCALARFNFFLNQPAPKNGLKSFIEAFIPKEIASNQVSPINSFIEFPDYDPPHHPYKRCIINHGQQMIPNISPSFIPLKYDTSFQHVAPLGFLPPTSFSQQFTLNTVSY